MNNYDSLTNEARLLLSKMYKTYLERINSGETREQANIFGNSHKIQEDIWPDEKTENVDLYAKELSKNKFIDAIYADDIVYKSSLSTSAISFLQHKFGNDLKKVGKAILDIASLFS